jgi:hypothetical protein
MPRNVHHGILDDDTLLFLFWCESFFYCSLRVFRAEFAEPDSWLKAIVGFE